MKEPSWIWHGGGLSAAKAHFGGANWLDLSTGINPHMWPGHQAMDVDWNRLPEAQDIAALETSAAAYFGCDLTCVQAVPGSEIAMRLLGQLLPAPFFHTEYSYRSHAELGKESRPVRREAGPPITDGTYILANPNNPDGAVSRKEDLLDLQTHRQCSSEGWLIVDEAFADCAPQDSLAPYVGAQRNLVVLRSFGKFFGMAGLRLGFVLAPPALLSRLRAALGAWPVSAAAIAFGKQAYGDVEWIAHMRTHLATQASRLDNILCKNGLSVSGNCPLFRLVCCENADALFRHLAGQSILTRPFDYADRWLRMGLPPTEEAFSRLNKALAGYA